MSFSFASIRQYGHPELPIIRRNTDAQVQSTYYKSVSQFNQNTKSLIEAYLPRGVPRESFEQKHHEFRDQILTNHKIPPKQRAVVETVDALAEIALQEPTPFQRQPALPIEKNEHKESISTSPDLQFLPTSVWNIVLEYASIDYWPFKTWTQLCKTASHLKDFGKNIIAPAPLKQILEKEPNLIDSLPNADAVCSILKATGFNPHRISQRMVGLNDQQLIALANHGERLESIHFQSCTFSEEAFTQFLRACPRLKSIEFNDMSTERFDRFMMILSVHAPKTLTGIKIVDCRHMTDKSLFALLPIADRITSFEVWSTQDNAAITDFGLFPFLSACEGLYRLKITGCPLITQIPVCHYVQQKNSEGQIKGEALVHFAFSYNAFTEVRLFNHLEAYCPYIESFELGLSPTQIREGQELLQAQALRTFLMGANELRSVKISDCPYFDRQTLHFLIDGKKEQLTHFEIYRCSDLEETSFKKLATCENLRCFKYEPLTPLQDISGDLVNLSVGCPRLETLSLLRCHASQDAVLSSIRLKERLRRLHLYETGTYNGLLLNGVAAYCPRLEALEVEAAADQDLHYNDKDIYRLAFRCQGLTTLHLKASLEGRNPLSLVSSISLKALGCFCRELVHLTLSHLDFKKNCSGNSEVEKNILYFARFCPRLQHLGLPGSQLNVKQAFLLFNKYSKQLLSLDVGWTTWFLAKEIFNLFLRFRTNLQYFFSNQLHLPLPFKRRITKVFPSLLYTNI